MNEYGVTADGIRLIPGRYIMYAFIIAGLILLLLRLRIYIIKKLGNIKEDKGESK